MEAFIIFWLINALAHICPKRLFTHIESNFGATKAWLVTIDFLALVLLHRADHVVEGFCPGHRPCSVQVASRSCACPHPTSLIVWLLDVTLINMHRYAVSFLLCIESLSIEGVLKLFISALDLTAWPIHPLRENMTLSGLV